MLIVFNYSVKAKTKYRCLNFFFFLISWVYRNGVKKKGLETITKVIKKQNYNFYGKQERSEAKSKDIRMFFAPVTANNSKSYDSSTNSEDCEDIIIID